MTDSRYLTAISPGMPATDGAGVQLTRMVGTPQLDTVDPFLMLDRIDSDDPDSYIAGFPNHPHRGFETVTIMLEGLMRHQDSVGNDGLLRPGDVQWMTAGRGIIHSELPEMIDGRLKGFQLWVNLPAEKKMMAPGYQDIPAEKISTASFAGGSARVIAGDFEGVHGPAQPQIPIRLMDVRLEAGTEWTVAPADGNDLFMCVYEGRVRAPDSEGHLHEVPAPGVAVFGGDGTVTITAGAEGADVLYCEGEPIREPVEKYGPFVMNTRDELQQAVDDFNAGKLAVG
ncbi:pirin family protein [bacterium]|nr:pirin family protein [bacterium]